jgi:hypothetical protein
MGHEASAGNTAHLAPEHAEVAGAEAAAPQLDGGQARVVDAPGAVAVDRQQVVGRQRQGVQVRQQLAWRCGDDLARRPALGK